jgi:nucleoside-diphosphate-sugar epimerase
MGMPSSRKKSASRVDGGAATCSLAGHLALAPIHEAPRQADIRHSYASIRKAEDLLGYRPQADVRDGLRQTVAWFKEHEC